MNKVILAILLVVIFASSGFADFNRGVMAIADSSGITWDSTHIIFQMLKHARYDVDTVYCMASATNYAPTRQAWRDSLVQYQAVVVMQSNLAGLGDTSTTGQGLPNYAIEAIYDYVNAGGQLYNFDTYQIHWIDDASDITSYLKIWGSMTIAGTAREDNIIVHGTDNIFNGYTVADRDSFDVFAGLAAVMPQYGVITAFGREVDTLVMCDETVDRPWVVAIDYGSGGYTVVWVAQYSNWLYNNYSVGTSLTFGAGHGLDYLLFAPLDRMTAANTISATMEMTRLCSATIDDTDSTQAQADINGRVIGMGLHVRNCIFLYAVDAADSAYLKAATDVGMITIVPHALEESDRIWSNAGVDWTAVEWDSIWDIVETHFIGGKLDTSGIILDIGIHSHYYSAYDGELDCTEDTLIAKFSYIDDVKSINGLLRPQGEPYNSKYFYYDWMQDEVGSKVKYTNMLWRPYYDAWDSAATPWLAPDVMGNGIHQADNAGSTDSLYYMQIALDYLLQKAQKAKAPVLFFVHGGGGSTKGMKLFSDATLDSLFDYYKAVLDTADVVMVPNLYSDMWSLYRDSIYFSEYKADKWSITYSLTQKDSTAAFPIPAYITLRRVMNDGELETERVFIPAGWKGTIKCNSKYNRSLRRWFHNPGSKANSYYIPADFHDPQHIGYF